MASLHQIHTKSACQQMFLKQWRQHLGITQQNLADRISTHLYGDGADARHFSVGNLSKYERGQSFPDGATMYVIQQSLGLDSIAMLFMRPDVFNAAKRMPSQKETMQTILSMFGT